MADRNLLFKSWLRLFDGGVSSHRPYLRLDGSPIISVTVAVTMTFYIGISFGVKNKQLHCPNAGLKKARTHKRCRIINKVKMRGQLFFSLTVFLVEKKI